MSASPIARQAYTHVQLIPSPKRVLITDANELPDVYASTPGGTLYSTTPGGTHIIYERAFLMNLKNSPLSRTPPSNIPAALVRKPNMPLSPPTNKNGTSPKYHNRYHHHHHRRSPPKLNDHQHDQQEQFQLEL